MADPVFSKKVERAFYIYTDFTTNIEHSLVILNIASVSYDADTMTTTIIMNNNTSYILNSQTNRKSVDIPVDQLDNYNKIREKIFNATFLIR